MGVCLSAELMPLKQWERIAMTPFPLPTPEMVADYDDLSDHSKLPQKVDVSVIVLAYNHRQFIAECLDSIVRQKTRFVFNIILSDDGSSDGTRDICQEYQRKYPSLIRLVAAKHNHKRLGVAKRVEDAIADHARYVMWCEGDDYWLDDQKIQKQIECLDAHQDVDACAARFRTFYSQENRLDSEQDSLGGGYVRRIFRNGFEFLHRNTLCVRLGAYREISEYINRTGIEYDLTVLLLLELGRGVYVLPDVVSVYRWTGLGVWTSWSPDEKRARHLQNMYQMAHALDFPKSIYFYSALLCEYCSCLRIFCKRWDAPSLVLALVRVMQYSLLYPVSLLYAAMYVALPKVLRKVRRTCRIGK